jgi:hypothetical protein
LFSTKPTLLTGTISAEYIFVCHAEGSCLSVKTSEPNRRLDRMSFILYLSIASAVFLIFCIQSLIPLAPLPTMLDTSLLPEQAVEISDNDHCYFRFPQAIPEAVVTCGLRMKVPLNSQM